MHLPIRYLAWPPNTHHLTFHLLQPQSPSSPPTCHHHHRRRRHHPGYIPSRPPSVSAISSTNKHQYTTWHHLRGYIHIQPSVLPLAPAQSPQSSLPFSFMHLPAGARRGPASRNSASPCKPLGILAPSGRNDAIPGQEGVRPDHTRPSPAMAQRPITNQGPLLSLPPPHSLASPLASLSVCPVWPRPGKHGT
ncbi:hypothetical protein B0I35DRAFT_247006 [Stachybotrys elegans]|uniref:Uncharacterized protein n=1 Tax=Stachybotrys elegans TaxID=80388 RepID=A0A8K0SSX1_9HYPO|nr:hypothetical protein B0I35DRAFT_247006 [Stachybotrys elegans]